MARKHIIQTDSLDEKISVNGENPHQTAFSQPKQPNPRGLARLNELSVQPILKTTPLKNTKIERKNILVSAEAHYYFKTTSALHNIKLLELVDFAVKNLNQMTPEELSNAIQKFTK